MLCFINSETTPLELFTETTANLGDLQHKPWDHGNRHRTKQYSTLWFLVNVAFFAVFLLASHSYEKKYFCLLRRHSLWYSDHRRLSPGDGRPGEAALLHSNLEMTSTKCVGKNFQPDKATNTRREHVRHHVDMITAQATRNASVSTHDLVLKH